MSSHSFSLEIDAPALEALGRRLKREKDGKALRKELAKNIRTALEPARDAARSGILGMSSAGLEQDGEPLRQAIARRIVVEARLGGRASGARIRAKKKGLPRGFALAAKRTNSAEGWRAPVRGEAGWRIQVGRPHWFDDATTKDRAKYRDAVIAAMEAMAERIADRR